MATKKASPNSKGKKSRKKSARAPNLTPDPTPSEVVSKETVNQLIRAQVAESLMKVVDNMAGAYGTAPVAQALADEAARLKK